LNAFQAFSMSNSTGQAQAARSNFIPSHLLNRRFEICECKLWIIRKGRVRHYLKIWE
jgi:hypothetical protein